MSRAIQVVKCIGTNKPTAKPRKNKTFEKNLKQLSPYLFNATAGAALWYY